MNNEAKKKAAIDYALMYDGCTDEQMLVDAFLNGARYGEQETLKRCGLLDKVERNIEEDFVALCDAFAISVDEVRAKKRTEEIAIKRIMVGGMLKALGYTYNEVADIIHRDRCSLYYYEKLTLGDAYGLPDWARVMWKREKGKFLA